MPGATHHRDQIATGRHPRANSTNIICQQALIEIYSANTRTVHNARLSEIERGECVLDRISEIVDLASALQIAPSELMSCRCQHWPTGTPKAL
jgi:hypothetical protein